MPTSGYRGEEKVAPDSWTETFVVAKLEIDNWRWAGTPFYLRHGKRLPRRITEIAIQNARQFTRLLTREGVAVKAVS